MSQERARPLLVRSTAFTLIEVMMTLALFGILVATAAPAMRRSSVSTKGAALALSAALTEARQQAITQQVPVALVIPSGNGSQGQANSYYIAAGEQPRVTQVKRLDGDQADLRLMVGHWPLDTSKLDNSTLTTTITPPPEAFWENDFDLNLWGLPAPKDYAFVFTPRGKLLSNDLPHFDGAYHIVVSAGGRSKAAPAAGTGGMTTQPDLYSLTQVGKPYTVAIDPSGTVSVRPGLTAAANVGVEIVEQAASLAPPDLPALAAPPSGTPVITSLTLLPDPEKLSPPDGVDMLLAPGRHMTMTVRAKSPDSVPLFCQWKATDGGLSSPQEVRATYLPLSQEWESVWQWRFPVEADPGDRVTLEGVVKDAYGNEAPVGLGSEAAPFVVQAGDPSTRVAFMSARTVSRDIFQINGDGTGLTNVSNHPGFETTPKLSPDGQRIVFRSDRDGNAEIYTMNADGTAQTRLAASGTYDHDPVWSPKGTQIAWCASRWPNGQNIAVMNADGTGLRKVSTLSSWQSSLTPPVWSPDGTRIAFTAYFADTAKYEIVVVNSDGSNQIRLTNSTEHTGGPIWTADPTKIAYTARRAGEWVVCLKNADGTGPETTWLTGNLQVLQWSPDGSQIAFNSSPNVYSNVFVMNSDGTNQTNLTDRAEHEYTVGWSGNGRQIAFWNSGQGEIFIMNADGTNQVNLSNDPSYDYEASIK